MMVLVNVRTWGLKLVVS